MWNLMHVMQLLAYLRLIIVMPANSQIMLLSVHNAVTLENVLKELYESILPDYFQKDEEE